MKASAIPLLTIATLVAASLPAAAQEVEDPGSADAGCGRALFLPLSGVGEPAADFGRVAELAGRAPLRSQVVRRPSDHPSAELCAGAGGLPWARGGPPPATDGNDVRLTPVRWTMVRNSAYPRNRGTEALWAGRGVSTGLQAGATVRRGSVSAGFVPVVAYQQNRSFATIPVNRAGLSPFVYPWHTGRIDWPQRFGDRAFWTYDVGQSFLRVDAYGFKAGVSNENLWWGPARHYPLLLGNTAPGFAHFFIGTARPRDVWVGNLDVEAFWGRLSESGYFDDDPTNDHRLLAGLAVVLEPRGVPGLFLGAARMFSMYTSDELGLWDYLTRPYRSIRENPLGADLLADNQIASLFARWAFPGTGFEVYAEWARNDHWMNTRDLLMEPDHSQTYMIGFQKVLSGGPRWYRLYGELVHLQAAAPWRGGRGVVSMYTHSQIRQGHTHRGQLLGAPIGPGSDAQILGLDRFTSRGRTGLFIERTRYDEDAYYNRFAMWYAQYAHDAEITGGIHHLAFWRGLEVLGAASYSLRYNRNFVDLDGFNWDLRTERNLHLRLELAWRPGVRSLPRPTPVEPEPPVTEPEPARTTDGRR